MNGRIPEVDRQSTSMAPWNPTRPENPTRKRGWSTRWSISLSVYPKSHPTSLPPLPIWSIWSIWKSTQNQRISTPFPAAPRHRPPGAESTPRAPPRGAAASPGSAGPRPARRAPCGPTRRSPAAWRRGRRPRRGRRRRGPNSFLDKMAEMLRKPLEKWEIRGTSKWPGRMWLDTASFGTGGNLGNLTILNGENHWKLWEEFICN